MRAAGRVTAALLGALAAVLLPAAAGAAHAGAAAGAAAVPTAVRAAGGAACVGVIVDARQLGGDVRTGCADGDPDSGFEALTGAGFGYAFVPRQPGLVCQVDGLPECARTSTTTYWSYWHRARGSSRWTYSSTGAGTFDPAPGSTEAWVWQDGGRREPPDIALGTICPQAARTAAPSTRPSRKASPVAAATTDSPATSSPQAARPTTAAPSGVRSTTSRTAGGTTAPAAGTTAPGQPAADPTVTAPATRAQGATVQAEPAGAQTSGTGQAWAGVVAGAGLVAALGGAAAVRSRRRGSP